MQVEWFLDGLIFEDGNYRLSRNVGKKLPVLRCVESRRNTYLVFIADGSLKSHKAAGCFQNCLSLDQKTLGQIWECRLIVQYKIPKFCNAVFLHYISDNFSAVLVKGIFPFTFYRNKYHPISTSNWYTSLLVCVLCWFMFLRALLSNYIIAVCCRSGRK